MRSPTRCIVILALIAAAASSGCAPRAVLFVDVLGDSTGLSITSLRVTRFSVRLGRSIDLAYPPNGTPSIDLPTSFVSNLRGDVENNDQIDLTVVAADAAGSTLLQGAVSAIVDLHDVTTVSVTLTRLGSCGDGTADASEDCDGADLAGETCASQGAAGGELSCATDCTFDLTACIPATCGDDTVDPGENCDGVDLGGADCTDAGPFSGGVLACLPTCAFDSSACDGPPSVPVLRLPMNNTYWGSALVSGSLRPEFVWEPSTVAGAAPVTYELQYGTDALFDVLQTTTIATAFTSNQPPADLVISPAPPVGARYYWRVRACAGSACSAYAATWWVNVGRTEHDLNGDGYADVAVGAYLNDSGATDGGLFYVFFGGAAGPFDGAAEGFVTGATAGAGLGLNVAHAGDWNADGFGDLLVAAPFDGPGEVHLYLGEAGAAFDTVADATFTGEVMADEFGVSLSSAGDTNADGFDDVVVGAWKNDVDGLDAGRAYVYLGGAGAPDTVVDGVILPEASGDWLGRAATGAGDVNGDGFADVAVAAPRNDAGGTDAGRTYVFLGSAGGSFDTTADITLAGQAAGQSLGLTLATARDPNGDGFADLLVRGPGLPGSIPDVFLFLGNASGTLGPLADATFSGTATNSFGAAMAGVGDVNGDAVDDIVVGAPLDSSGGMYAGQAFVFFGTAGAPPNATPDGTLSGSGAGSYFGTSIAAASDVDGDGLRDVLVGAPYVGGSDGEAFVFAGAPGAAFDPSADGVISGTGGEALGISVAKAETLGSASELVLIRSSRRRIPRRR